MKILLQFPEGLKQKALEHASKLEKEGHEVFISASPTFGACDLAIDEAKNIGAEKLIHFGHAEFHKVDFNVEYINYSYDAPTENLPKSLEYLKGFKTIGLMTTIQHIHQLDSIKKFYEDNGKKVIIGKPYGFAKKTGQILGCDIGSAASIDREVDVLVYFGGGLFHPLGALLHTKKPFLLIEPFNNTIEFLDRYRETYAKRSRGRIIASIDAKKVGILVSTKNGQHNMSLAKILKNKLEKEGIESGILVANTFDFESINNMMEFDAFVNTACPRIAIDDTDRTRKPLLSANEIMEVIRLRNERKELRKICSN
ncbi:MAG: diphthamide biosynthesis enzyme Dph2 [Candidatus Micrarchaeaceae archaeon]